MPTVDSINPFAKVNFGGSLSTLGSIALVIGIAVVIMGLVGFIIYVKTVKKKYWIIINVFRLIGNVPTRVAIYSAREVTFGMAGDKLWKVAPNGMFKLKTIKWLPVGKIQTAPREFWYYIREDGEWINFSLSDLNDIQKKAGVRFVQEDMRLQRLATERLLEQRLLNKTFWEKWGTVVMTVILFLVIAVCMVIMFFQWSKLLDKFAPLVTTMDNAMRIVVRQCGEGFAETGNYTGGSLIPA